ncbi:polysaccharide deacetylase family protein [Streptomyces sp. NPDC090306]|uniref:polysaccharide deacetylase family protein n=1 Tax=Streptomyces sp. NPDC090306 TaxID=3365961 RepID=UPI00382CAFA9
MNTPPKGSRPARLALAAVAAGLFCLPFAAAWEYQHYRQAVERQATAATGGPGADGKEAAGLARRVSSRLPDRAAPVVLAYHDVRPGEGGRYTVTPARFDAQLTALRAAGYRTLSTAQFVRALHGGAVPGRSVYLTFDDGAQGLWRYADPVLAKHGMRGAAYLITGNVRRRHGYYLSWDEVRRMARSGRWDFQDHTHRTHRRQAVDAAGRPGSALASRLWLPDLRRTETPAEYRRRVAADLDRSIAEFTAHGLPRPALFAYPFSESAGSRELRAGGSSLEALLRARFTASLTNVSSRPLPTGPRAAAAHQVERLEVGARTTVADLMERLADCTPVAPGADPAPLKASARWRFPTNLPGAGVGVLTGRGPYPRPHRYVSGAFRPVGSADWTAYTVDASVRGLHGTHASIAVTTRYASLRPLTASVSRGWLQVNEQRDGRVRTVAQHRLRAASAHRLRITVSPTSTVVRVDGGDVFTLRLSGRPAGEVSGGIGAGLTNGGSGEWPSFAKLDVRAGDGG